MKTTCVTIRENLWVCGLCKYQNPMYHRWCSACETWRETKPKAQVPKKVPVHQNTYAVKNGVHFFSQKPIPQQAPANVNHGEQFYTPMQYTTAAPAFVEHGEQFYTPMQYPAEPTDKPMTVTGEPDDFELGPEPDFLNSACTSIPTTPCFSPLTSTTSLVLDCSERYFGQPGEHQIVSSPGIERDFQWAESLLIEPASMESQIAAKEMSREDVRSLFTESIKRSALSGMTQKYQGEMPIASPTLLESTVSEELHMLPEAKADLKVEKKTCDQHKSNARSYLHVARTFQYI